MKNAIIIALVLIVSILTFVSIKIFNNKVDNTVVLNNQNNMNNDSNDIAAVKGLLSKMKTVYEAGDSLGAKELFKDRAQNSIDTSLVNTLTLDEQLSGYVADFEEQVKNGQTGDTDVDHFVLKKVNSNTIRVDSKSSFPFMFPVLVFCKQGEQWKWCQDSTRI